MSTPTMLSPVAAGERIEALDVVRGVALGGILLMNIEALAGPVFATATGVDPTLEGADRLVDALVYILVQGKFYTLFSLLFGMGFALMLARARDAGRPFAALYLRRTLVLLVIGLLHALLVWSGDILVPYALVAPVLLVFFRGTPVRRLPAWGVAIYLLPAFMALVGGLMGSATRADPAAAAGLATELAALQQAMDEAIAGQRAAQGGGDFGAAVARRWQDLRMTLGYLPVTGCHILGMFLLGAWFVRSGALTPPAASGDLQARLRWVAMPLGLALMLVSYRMVPTIEFGRLDVVTGLASALAIVAGLLMCLGYFAWILRALEAGGRLSRGLRALAPAGRMALTNYLLQSLACTVVFAGYGLGGFGQVPRAWQVPFALALFALQVGASHWWLARHRFGPVEWLWRSATYGRLQPMGRAASR